MKENGIRFANLVRKEKRSTSMEVMCLLALHKVILHRINKMFYNRLHILIFCYLMFLGDLLYSNAFDGMTSSLKS